MYDETIRKLRELASIPAHCENVESCDGCSKEDICLSFTNARIIETATQAADAIEKLSKPRWIPVTERMPEEDEEVLVVAVNNFNKDDRWAAIDWLCCGTWQQHAIVTHWMPLPEPPKEE